MTITTELKGVTMEGVAIGVSIKRERPEIYKSGTDFISPILADLFDTMEIYSILRALKDSNEKTFNRVMESFIEEELAEEKKESEDE